VKARDGLVALIGRSGMGQNRQCSAVALAGSHRADGSGAPSARRLLTVAASPRILIAAALTLFALALTAAPASADTLPTITTNAAEDVGVTTVKLSGTVNPHGASGDGPTTWRIQYRLQGETAWVNANEGTIEAPASEEANAVDVGAIFGFNGELQPGETYEFSLQAENGAGQVETPAPLTFTMDAATAPVLATTAATDLAYTTATLHGTVDPEGGNLNPIGPEALPIEWQLQYSLENDAGEPEGWSTGGGGTISGAEAESTDPIDIEAPLAPGSLIPAKKYLVRVFAYYAIPLYRETESPQPPTTSFTTLAVTPPAITAPLAITAITGTSAHLAGTVDTPNNADPAFKVSWDFACSPECPNLKGGSLPADGASHPVAVDAKGLDPNTPYTVTLTATNSGGKAEASKAFSTSGSKPVLTPFDAAPIGSDQVTLNGQVNPQKSPTTYRFEWGSADCGTSACQSLPTGDAGSGAGAVFASAQLTGLSPATTYHFRLLAENGYGTTEGPDQTFTTASAPSSCANDGFPGVGFLPNCRAWEMVSPVAKNGGEVITDTARTRSAADGEAVTFPSLTGFGDVVGGGVAVDYMASRTAEPGTQGWATHAISPRVDPLTFGGAVASGDPLYVGDFSADLSRGIYRSFGPLPGVPDAPPVPNFYLRTDLTTRGAGSYELLTKSVNPIPASLTTPTLGGTSKDFTHVIVETTRNLTADAQGGGRKVYDVHDGAPDLISIGPDGSPFPDARVGLGANESYVPRVISTDGSRIFFQDQNKSGGLPGNLYLRVDDRSTVQLNRAAPSLASAPAPANLWWASRDGTRAFFITNQALTPDDTNDGPDLYMWRLQQEDERQSISVSATGGNFTLTFEGATTAPIDFGAPASGPGSVQSALEALKGPVPFEDQQLIVPGNIAVSGGPGDATGSSPYSITFTGDFSGTDMPQLEVDASDLTGSAATATVTTIEPINNLTRVSVDQAGRDASSVSGVVGGSDDGRTVYFTASEQLASGEPDFASTLGGNGLYLWREGSPLKYIGAFQPGGDSQVNTIGTNWSFPGSTLTARVTPDGDRLVFMTTNSVGFQGRGGFSGFDHGSTCTYETTIGGPCRELFVYSAVSGRLECASCSSPGVEPVGDALLRVLNGQGGSSTSFHLSHALSDDGRYLFFSTGEPLVAGDTNGKIDAYSFDIDSGRTNLISSGTSQADSYFLDASNDGDDVFFTTAEQLSGWDRDRLYDLYDARVGGGFEDPSLGTATCQGDTCRPSSTPSPLPAPAASATVFGPGNRVCRKGHRTHTSKGKKRRNRCNPKSKKHAEKTGGRKRAGSLREMGR
jgi:hypothetical protein